MSNQKLVVGEPFTFRVPLGAPMNVVAYLNHYRQAHSKGFSEHLFFLLQRGMEAEGIVAPPPSPSSRRTAASAPSTSAQPSRVTSQLTSSNTGATPESKSGGRTVSHLDLSNFD